MCVVLCCCCCCCCCSNRSVVVAVVVCLLPCVVSACAAAPTRVCHTSLQITCTLIQLSLGVSFTSHPQFLKLKHATLAAMGPRGPYAFNRGSNTHVTKCSIALAPYPFPSPLPCNAFRLLLRDDVCRLSRFLHTFTFREAVTEIYI